VTCFDGIMATSATLAHVRSRLISSAKAWQFDQKGVRHGSDGRSGDAGKEPLSSPGAGGSKFFDQSRSLLAWVGGSLRSLLAHEDPSPTAKGDFHRR
jgi:hypothetical protein